MRFHCRPIWPMGNHTFNTEYILLAFVTFTHLKVGICANMSVGRNTQHHYLLICGVRQSVVNIVNSTHMKVQYIMW